MHDVKSLSVSEYFSFIGVVLLLPFHLISAVIYRLLQNPKTNASSKLCKKTKSIAQTIEESALCVIPGLFTPRQIQWAFGTSEDAYRKWAGGMGLDVLVEDVAGTALGIGEDGVKLFWLTTERRDRVVVYVHGGGYISPMTNTMLGFCPALREAYLANASSTGKDLNDFGIVALAYSLHPAAFPTQLTELTLAITHLIARGTPASNIVLLGDSAGANLIIQFLLHSMYPVPIPGVPPSPFSPSSHSAYTPSQTPADLQWTAQTQSHLTGVLLVSPWCSLDNFIPPSDGSAALDVVNPDTLRSWGETYMNSVPRGYEGWVQPLGQRYTDISTEKSDALQSPLCFAALSSLTSHILITAGGAENLLGDAQGLYSAICAQTRSCGTDLGREGDNAKFDVKLDVEEGVGHEETMFNVANPVRRSAAGSKGGMELRSKLVPREDLSEATMRIVAWIRESFDEESAEYGKRVIAG